jgi:hypothetical protein
LFACGLFNTSTITGTSADHVGVISIVSCI